MFDLINDFFGSHMTNLLRGIENEMLESGIPVQSTPTGFVYNKEADRYELTIELCNDVNECDIKVHLDDGHVLCVDSVYVSDKSRHAYNYSECIPEDADSNTINAVADGKTLTVSLARIDRTETPSTISIPVKQAVEDDDEERVSSYESHRCRLNGEPITRQDDLLL